MNSNIENPKELFRHHIFYFFRRLLDDDFKCIAITLRVLIKVNSLYRIQVPRLERILIITLSLYGEPKESPGIQFVLCHSYLVISSNCVHD